MELACAAPAVVCCRCTPTQKATIVRLIQQHTGKRTAAIGDGGNDVSMIQAADTGVGIVGKEGKQVLLQFHFFTISIFLLFTFILGFTCCGFFYSAIQPHCSLALGSR